MGVKNAVSLAKFMTFKYMNGLKNIERYSALLHGKGIET